MRIIILTNYYVVGKNLFEILHDSVKKVSRLLRVMFIGIAIVWLSM